MLLQRHVKTDFDFHDFVTNKGLFFKFILLKSADHNSCVVSPLVPEVRAERVDDDGRRHGDIETVQVGVHSSTGGDTDCLLDLRQEVSRDAFTLATKYWK